MDNNNNNNNKFNKCNICKIRGYIECNQCDEEIYFCSRGHLHTHQLKFHKKLNANSTERNIHSAKNPKFNINQNQIQNSDYKINNLNNNNNNNLNNIDPRKQFESLQNAKNEIENKIKENRISEAMININKLLNLSTRFYPNDHLFVKKILTNKFYK